ncbi:MAG TPA: hypothetical protein VGL62_05130, partial [Vicinamibacterales bacterium]
EARRARFGAEYHLPEYDAEVLTQSVALAAYFERVAAASGNAKAASNWVMGDVMRKVNETRASIDALPVSADALAELVRLVDSRAITGPIAKEVFEKMYASGRGAAAIVRDEGLAAIHDVDEIARVVADVLRAHASAVTDYRAGKTKSFGFLVGQVMKAMGGKGDPVRVNDAVRRALAEADQ